MTKQNKTHSTNREERILTVYGKRHPGFPAPPALTKRPGDGSDYLAYYQNCYGEQWILRLDRRGNGTLSGDETGWESLTVQGGVIKAPLALDAREAAWYRAALGAVVDVPEQALTYPEHFAAGMKLLGAKLTAGTGDSISAMVGRLAT